VDHTVHIQCLHCGPHCRYCLFYFLFQKLFGRIGSSMAIRPKVLGLDVNIKPKSRQTQDYWVWHGYQIQYRSNSLGSSDHATPKRIESSGQTKPKNLVCGPKVLKPAWLSDPCIGSRTINHGRLGGLSCTIVNCCKKSWIAKIERWKN
jgi:hypothetical protein